MHSTLPKNPRVAIIGAGLAGLTTAYRLSQLGIPSEIYEARERAGGRVFTYYSGTSFEELGGKLLHYDDDATHIHSLLSELGLNIESYTIPSPTQLYYRDGEAHDYFTFFKDAPPPTEKTYAALIAQAQKSVTMQEVLQWFFSAHPELLRLFMLFLLNYEGASADQLGTYFTETFWKFYTREYGNAAKKAQGISPVFSVEAIQGGGTRLVQALCAKLKKPIHYRSAVKKIYRRSPKKIVIECEEQPRKLFDKVILTVPCSTLCEIETDLFPSDQREAIQTLPYGTLGKILFPVNADEKAPLISYGTDFISMFNKERTFLTLYCSNKALWLNFNNLYALEKHLQQHLNILKVLYPSLEIIGEPILINWTAEPYSKGSYSHFGIDQLDRFNQKSTVFGEEVKHAFRPVDEQIFFAGEHTAFKYYATMEGAVESGDRAARMVAKSFAGTSS